MAWALTGCLHDLDPRAVECGLAAGLTTLVLLVLMLGSLGDVGPLHLLVVLVPALATGVFIGMGTAPPAKQARK